VGFKNRHDRAGPIVNNFGAEAPVLIHKLKVMFANVDTLSNKHTEFVSYVALHEPKLIALCEIYPKNAKSSDASDIQLDNYDRFLPERTGDRGVVIYAHSSLRAVRIDEFDDANFNESLWCAIRLANNDSLLVGCVYRSPNSAEGNNDKLITLMNKVCSASYSHILVLGDFNYKEIKWKDNVVDKAEDSSVYRFYECVQDNYLTQHVDEDTRHRGGQKPSLLDLVFTNEENMIDSDNISYDFPLGNSDHCILLMDYNCYTIDNTSCAPRYKYYKGNYSELQSDLAKEDWDTLLSSREVEINWQAFKSILTKHMDNHIPVTSGRARRNATQSSPLWMNKDISAVIAKKRRAWKRYNHSRAYKDYDKYKLVRNECRITVRQAKLEYEKKIALEASTDNKSFWKYIQSKTKTRTGVGDLYKPNGDLTVGEEEKVNVLNDFFCSVFTREADLPDSATCQEREFAQELTSIEISEEDVLKKLNRLKTDKSPGPDGLHPKVLFETRDFIYKPLSIILQQSMETGTVPCDWKIANVSPIFKKGDKKSPGNYRPVSLTSIICKLCESIIRDKIMNHMENNNLFSSQQYGFRPRRSCTTQLLEVFDTWTKFVDEGQPVDTIYLDFSKAFDTVPHQRLGTKLQSYGIKGKILKWIMTFLGAKTEESDHTYRKQRVSYHSHKSDWKDVISGVPQGSVLGPVLFLIFINDLPDVVQGLVKIFADDTKLFNGVTCEEDSKQIQLDLDHLCDWSRKWSLYFNASKCKVLHIGRTNPKYTYWMTSSDSREEIKEDSEEKDLGVTFDASLKFSKHIINCVNKANRITGLIKRSFDFMDKEMFATLYKSLVRPLVEYATPVWSPYLKKDIRLLEKVQRRATKIVPVCKNLDYSQRLLELGLPTLEYRRDRYDMIQVYKILSGIEDVDPESLFVFHTSVTRGHSRKLYKQRAITTVRQTSFVCRITDTWNNLPEDVVMAKTLNSFKSGLNNTNWNGNKFRPS
jgi:hypothetical protein